MAFIRIWGLIFLIGIVFFPLTSCIFKNFNDRGWLFSKLLGICISSFTVWFISSAKMVPYSVISSYAIIFLYAVVNFIIIIKKKEKSGLSVKEYLKNNRKLIKNIFLSELLFIILFGVWTYIKGYNPGLNNYTEQFMDYGYMNATMITSYMPPKDIWLSGETINYYYFGQYISGFICKLSGLSASYGYNYIIAFIASCTFVLPFSIGYNLFIHKYKKRNPKKKAILPFIVALSIGFAVSFGGSMHYPIYRWLSPIEEGYYYVDETRYIGYKPEVPDKTATEVPAYSSVVGDLHAHYIDLAITLTTIALLAQFFIEKEEKKNYLKPRYPIIMLLLSLMLGISKMTNYWDFPIYIVIISSVIASKKLICGKCDKKAIINTVLMIFSIIIIEEFLTLPFTLNLYVSSTEVCFTGIMSPFYKLLVKWGLPYLCTIIFLIVFLRRHKQENIKFKKFLNENLSDFFVVILGLCACGLVLLPEIIYLKDIYGDDYKRFNTMFKLTYQAFLLFGICTTYYIAKFITNKKKIIEGIATVVLVIYSTTFIYGFDTIISNYKYVKYQGITEETTESFIKSNIPDDWEAILWIRDNIPKDKIILEQTALGNCYSTSSRVSIFTGNPTVLGWSYHEWVWRSNKDHSIPAEVTTRNFDVQQIYTSNQDHFVRELLNKYNVDYIFIGSLEYEKYPEMDINFMKTLGEIVYQNENVFIIKYIQTGD